VRAGRPDPPAAADAVADEIGFARRLVRRVGGRLVVAFACIALPLWLFGELAEDVIEGEPFGFDEPLLRLAHAASGPEADAVFLALSAVGFGWGVIPVDIALVLGLSLRRRFREATFAALALGGSALLNIVAKHSFRRDRPALWESIAPESTYSFPSGHAMGSATLACTLVALAWHTRLRAPALVLAIPFVAGVGLSRVYLGVHYPSDIVAGWTAALAWTIAVYFAVYRRGQRPWGRRRG
jgi:undecaprenyl-diphosphatase